MTKLHQALDDYLSIRRAVGFDLRETERSLRKFITFLEQENASHITTDLALRWARQPADGDSATWAARLGKIRKFAAWYAARDPRTEVPAEGLIPYTYCRKAPYIYSDSEISRLIQAASALTSPLGLRGQTYATVLGLLAVTGMRVSEAVKLNRCDVDSNEGLLTIQQTKFSKSRIVPLHISTNEALLCYAEARDALFPVTITKAFFLTERGTRINACSIRYNFARASSRVGLRAPFKYHHYGHGPRLHDLRHRFAVRTLINWYRGGLDVEREMPKLSTYLGHAHINDTYWYLEAVPELLQLATKRLDKDEGDS